MDSVNKVLAWVKKNICVIAIMLVAGIYFLRNFIAVDMSGKSVAEIIADGALAGITGYIISLLFTKQGEKDGEEHEGLKTAIADYMGIKKRAESFADKLSAWCGVRNKTDLEEYQREILSAACVSWSEFNEHKYTVNKKDRKNNLFTTVVVTEDELWGIKRKAVKKARRAKITPLTDNMLMTEAKRTKDPHAIGRNIQEYNISTSITNASNKLLLGVLFGYFAIKMLEEFSPAAAIWAGIQIVMFVGFGVVSYMVAKLYMSTEYKGRYEAKAKYLNEFCIDMERRSDEIRQVEAETRSLAAKEKEDE